MFRICILRVILYTILFGLSLFFHVEIKVFIIIIIIIIKCKTHKLLVTTTKAQHSICQLAKVISI